MSDIRAVRALLLQSVPLLAIVPAVRIVAGPLELGAALPALSIEHISTTRRHNVSTEPPFCTARVQVTALAATFAEQKALLTLVRAALPRHPGTVGGVKVDTILSDSDGPDFRVDTAIYAGSQDFLISYTE